MISRFVFWLWHKSISNALRKNPIGTVIWGMRVVLIYEPLFKKGGLEAVWKEHSRYVAEIREKYVDN